MPIVHLLGKQEFNSKDVDYASAIQMEIDMLLEVYPDAQHSEALGPFGVRCDTVSLHLAATGLPVRQVVLTVGLVYGYPFVAPNVNVEYRSPAAETVGADGHADPAWRAELATLLQDAVAPCVGAGQPCLLQIFSCVESYFAPRPLPAPLSTVTVASSTTAAPVTTTGGNAVPSESTKALIKHTRKLGALVLHLTHKCCALQASDSREEAEDNFRYLMRYLTDEVAVIPPEVSRLWTPQKTLRAGYRSHMDAVDEDSRQCLKWFWDSPSAAANVDDAAAAVASHQRFSKEFYQQRRIGTGGFAPVFVCRKKVDGRLYAIKKVVLRTQQSAKALREVQTLAALDHEHIVRYYDAWVEPGVDPDLEDFAKTLDDEESEEQTRSTSTCSSTDSSEHASADRFALPPSNARACGVRQYGASNFYCDSDDDEEHDTTDGTCVAASNVRSPVSLGMGTPVQTPDQLPQSPFLVHGVQHKYHTLYIQMELCAAKNLRHLLDSGAFATPSGEKLAATILRQLLAVISHVHRENVVHRDLKPDNVLFQSVGEIGGSANSSVPESVGTHIKVADFGLARTLPNSLFHSRSGHLDGLDDLVTEDTTESFGSPPTQVVTTNCGTVLYCAPEQAHGTTYDARVDEYSIGMIALEMWLAVAGKDFRERYATLGHVSRQRGQLPEWFTTWNPRIATIIQSLLVYDPRRRATCDSILGNVHLPGEPQEVTDALETLALHAPRLVGRLIQRLQDYFLSTFRRKPVSQASLLSVTPCCVELHRQMEVLALLHGACSIPYLEHMIPLAPTLRDIHSGGSSALVDEGGKCFVAAPHPHLSIASFLTSHRGKFAEDMFAFYYSGKAASQVTYNIGCLHSTTSFDIRVQPLLYVMQLLGGLDVSCATETSPLKIVVSYLSGIAHERTTSDSASTCDDASSREASAHTLDDRQDTAHPIGDVAPFVKVSSVAEVTSALHPDGLLGKFGGLDSEEECALRDTATAVLHCLPYFFAMRTSRAVEVFLRRVSLGDATPLVSESAPLDAELATCGLVVEIGYGAVSPRNDQLHLTSTVAVGCDLQTFVAYVSPYHSVSAFLVTLDVSLLQSLVKRVARSVVGAVMLEGIVVCKTLSDPLQKDTAANVAAGGSCDTVALDCACRLLSFGHRIWLRSKVSSRELSTFRDQALARHYAWLLSGDPVKLCSVASMTTKPVRFDVELDHLAADVRAVLTMHGRWFTSNAMKDSAVAATVATNTGVAGAAGQSGSGLSSTVQVAARDNVGWLSSSGEKVFQQRVEFAGKEDSCAVQDAKDAFSLYTILPITNILAAHCSAAEVRMVANEFLASLEQDCHNGGSSAPVSPGIVPHNGKSGGVHMFSDWLRRHYTAYPHPLIPVYSLIDRRIELVSNHQKAKSMLSAGPTKGSAISKSGGGNSSNKKKGRH